MSMVDRLLAQLKNRGIRVVYVSDTELRLSGDTKNADEKLIAAVKAFKPDLLERLRPRDPDARRFDVHHPAPPEEAAVAEPAPT